MRPTPDPRDDRVFTIALLAAAALVWCGAMWWLVYALKIGA